MKFDEVGLPQKQSDLAPASAVKQSVSFSPETRQPEIQAAPEVGFQVLERNLENCLQLIDEDVMKSYIPELSRLSIIEPDIDISEFEKEPFQFFRITRLVYEKDEFSISKLTAVFQTIANTNSTLVLMIHNHNNTAEFYLGVRNHDTANRTGEMRQMLEMSLNGQFPGSSVSRASIEEIKELTQNNKLYTKSISSVTCVADYKQKKESHENKDFLQGLEKFIISMQSKDYTAVFIAETVSRTVLDERRKELEQIYSQLSPFTNMQFQYGSSSGHSDGNTQNTGRTYTTTDGISNTQGITDSLSFSKTEGTSETETDSATHTKNQSTAHGTSKGTTETDTTGHSTADGTSHTVTDTKSISGTFGGSFNMSAFSSITNTVGTAINAGINAGTKRLGGSVGGSRSFSNSVTNGTSSGFGINGSVTTGRSHGVSDGTSHTETKSRSHSSSLANTISDTLTEGLSDSSTIGHSHGITSSATDTVSKALSLQKGQNHSFSEAISIGQSESTTETTGVTQGITMQYKNMTLNNMLQRIEMQIKRLNECESLGMWNCAAYFLGTSRTISETAANAYYSLVAGEHSGIERSAVNTWQNPQDVSKLEGYISHFLHPAFEYYRKKDHSLQKINPSVLVSTKELAIQYSFPKKSVCGLPVAEHAVFGQQIIKKRKGSLSAGTEPQKTITIGSVYHLDDTLPMKVELDLDSLCMHTLVSGSTGSGKSNAVYDILEQLYEKNIPYLVIEPAKGEYKECIPADYIYGTNPMKGELLQLNPFSFPPEIHVQEHIDKLTEIFNVCWPMYAAMPAILKKAIIRSYEVVGWDMLYSRNSVRNDLFPTFEEVCQQLEEVMQNTEYSSDTGNDYRGALKTRVSSLTDGINGMIFSHQEVDNALLFNANTIVDLSRVGSPETKSLIMGILILKLQEYRISENKGINQHFRHMTVLEEAHHLLKRTSTEQSQESANLTGKSVEMLTNAIAEMRTYGEGFLIADQSPSMLDSAAIRNTNTKIILRLPEEQDRTSVGKSIVLDDKQIQELSKLPTGVAAVYQNDWQETVLCDIVLHTPRSLEFRKTRNQKFTELLKMLLHGTADKNAFALIQSTDFPEEMKNSLLACFQDRSDKNLIQTLGEFITAAFHWEHIFYRTSETCTTIEEVAAVITENLRQMFPEFSDDEISATAYYICSYQYQLNPENTVLQLVSQYCFSKKVEVN